MCYVEFENHKDRQERANTRHRFPSISDLFDGDNLYIFAISYDSYFKDFYDLFAT